VILFKALLEVQEQYEQLRVHADGEIAAAHAAAEKSKRQLVQENERMQMSFQIMGMAKR
jgi:hypothetical protein